MLKQPLSRILEIDALRGVAIILMVIFHIIVDLTDFYGYHFQYLSGFWYYEGKAAAILFMLLAGVSSSFSRSAVRHGLELLAWGMVLTAVTWLFAPAMYIRFGILHFLGTSLLTCRCSKNCSHEHYCSWLQARLRRGDMWPHSQDQRSGCCPLVSCQQTLRPWTIIRCFRGMECL